MKMQIMETGTEGMPVYLQTITRMQLNLTESISRLDPDALLKRKEEQVASTLDHLQGNATANEVLQEDHQLWRS